MNPTDPNQNHPPRRYPWDHWEQHALKQGMPEELATLGRAVIREVDQHAWPSMFRQICSQRTVLEVLTKAPDLGKRLYEVLLETDGLRVAFAEGDEASSEMIQLQLF